jgi:putative ABC transport system permease protein
VRIYFPKNDAIGSAVELTELREPPRQLTLDAFTVVGVVGDLRNLGLRRDLMPEVYIPFTTTGFHESDVVLLATSTLPMTTLIGPIKTELYAIDRDQPVMDVRTMQAMMDAWGFAEPRFSVFLFSAFASLGLLLAAVGIYALINYSVVRQTREIGVRMALGAQPLTILRMVIGDGARLVAIGGVVGIALSLACARLLNSLVWGVSPFDPLSFLIVIAVLVVAGLFASAVPALRAARINPMAALRYE